MNRNLLHKALSTRSRLLDLVGKAALRFYLYRENAFFHPDYNGEHRLLELLEKAGVRPRTIFDIGANEGRWSAHVLERWPDASVHQFEPVPAIASRLKERFAGSKAVHVHPCAVGGADGTVYYHENKQLSSHSFVAPRGDAENQVLLVSGATAFELAGIDHLDLCKIDAEGFDLEILHGLEPQLAKGQISFIQFEHHALGVSYQRSFASTSAFLRDLGYRIGKIFPEGLREVDYGAHNWSNQVGPNFLAASPAQTHIFEAFLSR